METKLESYKPAHYSGLLQLIRLNTPLYFAPEEETDYKRYLQNEVEDYYTLKAAGKIVAAGGINYTPDHIFISWDVVHPDYQGKGLGKELLQFRLQVIRKKRDNQKVIVRTSQKTYLFYAKAGFELVETVKDYWAPGLDLYYMEWREF